MTSSFVLTCPLPERYYTCMPSDAVIYLDYAATTPVYPGVSAVMHACLEADGTFANPASQHAPGRAAREVVEAARATMGAVIHADPAALVFTSGATEACNLAIKGAARLHTAQGQHLITLQ